MRSKADVPPLLLNCMCVLPYIEIVNGDMADGDGTNGDGIDVNAGDAACCNRDPKPGEDVEAGGEDW